MTRKELEFVIKRTVQEVLEAQKQENSINNEEWVSTGEAAKILGLSEYRVRELKDRFVHVKQGTGTSGRLLFQRSTLLKNYLSNH